MPISPYGHNDMGTEAEWAAYHARVKREEESLRMESHGEIRESLNDELTRLRLENARLKAATEIMRKELHDIVYKCHCIKEGSLVFKIWDVERVAKDALADAQQALAANTGEGEKDGR